jgi:4-hydroxy-tetrahydrodipicolinate synthase
MDKRLNNLVGIVPPMITPLVARDHLDVPGLQRLVERQITGGVHGLFILGTCGEGTALSGKLRREMIQRTCQNVSGRLPVLIGVTDTSVAESLELARYAADRGAGAIVISAPYYLPLDQDELEAYGRMMAAEQPLPIFLYNIPSLTRTAYAFETVVRLAEVPQIIGIKDSSGDTSYLRELQRRIHREGWRFFIGAELLMVDAVIAGAHGGVAGGALIAPELFVSLYEAAVKHDRQRIAALMQGVRIIERMYKLAPGFASIIRGLKCALGCMGICSDRMADPHRGYSDADRSQVRRLLAELSGVN